MGVACAVLPAVKSGRQEKALPGKFENARPFLVVWLMRYLERAALSWSRKVVTHEQGCCQFVAKFSNSAARALALEPPNSSLRPSGPPLRAHG
jgi:hypothetical protein